MKKTILASLVGAVIMFLWQFLSWGILNMQHAAQEYTPKQDSIMAYLNSQFTEDESYFMPTFPNGTSREEQDKLMNSPAGKPWAIVSYHKAMNMARGFS